MRKTKLFTGILSAVLCLCLTLPAFALPEENTVGQENTSTEAQPKPQAQDSANTETNETEPETPAFMTQEEADFLNNNNNLIEEVPEASAGDNMEATDNDPSIYGTGTIQDDFKVDPVTSPFYFRNTTNETVTLNTGDLTFEQKL